MPVWNYWQLTHRGDSQLFCPFNIEYSYYTSLEFLGIRAFPIRYREMQNYPSLNVNDDMELDIIFFRGSALYSDVKPLTACFKAESRAIHSNIHAPSPHLKGDDP
jgi:hypothetical protein